jgi:hypothetical protein
MRLLRVLHLDGREFLIVTEDRESPEDTMDWVASAIQTEPENLDFDTVPSIKIFEGDLGVAVGDVMEIRSYG